MKRNMDKLVLFVDSVKNRCPGTIRGKRLIPIAIQKERRIFKRLFKPIKTYIFVLEGTRNIYYKQDLCHPSVIAFGYSKDDPDWDGKSVPMEIYAKLFIDRVDPEWLERNDYTIL